MLVKLFVLWILMSLFCGSRTAGSAIRFFFGIIVFFWGLRLLFGFGLIGKALLDYSVNIACETADKFFLVVSDYNPDAKRFYERNGYQQVGEIPNL